MGGLVSSLVVRSGVDATRCGANIVLTPYKIQAASCRSLTVPGTRSGFVNDPNIVETAE